MKKRRRKLIIYWFEEKPLKPSKENGKENLIRIEDRDKTSRGSRSEA